MNPGMRSSARRAGGRALFALAALLLVAAAPACGRKRASRAHAGEETPVAAVPTPDNTPIDVL